MLGKKSILLVSILFILTGIFLRLYQLNFENYWLDELIDFWVADPNITLHATFVRRDELIVDQTPYLFPTASKMHQFVSEIFQELKHEYLPFLHMY